MFANFLITLASYQTYEMCFSKKSKHIEKEAFCFAEKQYFVKKNSLSFLKPTRKK